ncbi:MAG: class I SAM-dependent rRNA methyltransferase [Verrucomicrobia bacterium]|nr:class I SAM-dependent rRNA methyltransferase [Verrucomicrobiota bacterium]
MAINELQIPTVILRPGEADRVVGGHPWVYKGSILRLAQPAADGAVVQVKDHRHRFLGVGFYNSKSKIHVRMLDSERVEIDRAFFEHRIHEALELRRRHLPGLTSYRVVNAEGDFLSGLIVDKYEDVLVLQTSSLGMDQRKGMIVEVLKEALSPRAVIERNDIASRKFDGLDEAKGVLDGDFPDAEMSRFPIEMNGLKMSVDIAGGHKTGLYLDQQLNQRLVADFAKGARVLDCFTFLGGFALHAARAGAEQVMGIDQAAEVVEAARRNAKENGLEARCSFEAANVFDWLKAETVVRPHEKVVPRFDLIVLDPPSFTRNRASVPDALRGYKEIHLRALKLLRKGGVLATFCCSHHISATMFQDVVRDAAVDARRVLRRIATYSQSLDHPIIPSIPETEYLKGFAFELVR